MYSGDGLFASWENENVTYSIPEEGSAIWVDNLGIPSRSPHKYTAETFINYILRAEVSGDIANYLWQANCNDAAREFTDSEILEDPSLYPKDEILKNCEYFASEHKPEVENKINEIREELMI